jgi:hypothetical protein
MTSKTHSRPTRICKATLGTDGKVIRGDEITEEVAVAERKAERHVVVCGNDIRATRALAQAIENQVGPWERQPPHTKSAGPFALPHYQQLKKPPQGHTFYETEKKKAFGKR